MASALISATILGHDPRILPRPGARVGLCLSLLSGPTRRFGGTVEKLL